MKKVGIMTWFQYHNYGTALQVTALSETVRKLGYEPLVIDYSAKNKLPATLYDENLFHKYKNKIYKRIRMRNFISEEREQKFIDFYQQHLTFTKRCSLLSELEDLNQELDAFICGSDQIWAPSCFDSHYFLDFVSDNYKKIAYAPSVGLPVIADKDIQRQIRKLTRNFGFLSTREESGSVMISKLSGRKVETVLDPTLLLNSKQWHEISGYVEIDEKVPYLLVYMLGRNEQQWKRIYQIAKQKNLQVKIIPVFLSDLKREGCLKNSIGAIEFLSYIKNADYICTDSFHGMAFSINFHKEFTVFERFKEKDKLNQNSRIYHLLKKLNLENRLFHRQEDMKMLSDKIDYIQVEKIREMLKKESLHYLKNALELATQHQTDKKKHIQSDYSLCCGCGACEVVCPCDAIQIKMNQDGFYQASIDNQVCISCGRCRKVCPYIVRNDNQDIADAKLYAFKSKSAEVLSKSSSGGAAFHIASMLSEKGYAVAGCTFDVSSQTAKHIIIAPHRTETLSKLQGSKYMQSNFSEITEQLYRSDVPIVIFGTPCQIAGMRNLLKNRENVLFVDLICHGVPSYHLYEKYQAYLKEKGFDTENLTIKFRDKQFGWRERYIYSGDLNHSQSVYQDKDMYFLAFEHGFCYSHSCYECPYRDKSCADIRLGDYWGKRFEKDKTGVSEVVIMTEKGAEIIKELQNSGVAAVSEQDILDYITVQQMQNGREPVFWHSYVANLSNPDMKLEDITQYYIMPFQRRKKFRQAILKMIRR